MTNPDILIMLPYRGHKVQIIGFLGGNFEATGGATLIAEVCRSGRTLAEAAGSFLVSGTGVPPVNGHGQDGGATVNDTTP